MGDAGVQAYPGTLFWHVIFDTRVHMTTPDLSTSDSFEQALEFARAALQGMTTHSIAPTPENFLVWYTHIAGRNPNLSHMISILADNNQEITNSISRDIHDRFFTTSVEDDALHETAERINEELKHIIEYMDKAGGDVTKYGETLHTVEGELSSGGEPVGLGEVIAKVLTETRKMEDINNKLEQKLTDSTSEVSQLREDLEDMRRETLTDALTGISNRKMFDMELRRAARDAMENGSDLSLLMIDIDFFKKFNDTFGHQVGDEVLKLLAGTLAKTVKGTDIPVRYGGEEFAVILPSTNLDGAYSVGEAIRTRISTKKLINRQTNTSLGKITVSVGISQFDYGERIADFIRRADQALYTAKKLGRNRVISQIDMEKDALSFD